MSGVGVAMLGAGVLFSVLQSSATNEVNNYDKRSSGRAPAQGRREIEDLKEDANDYYRNALIFYLAGGAVTTAGLGLLFYGLSQPDDARAIRLHAGAHTQGAWLGFERLVLAPPRP